MLLPAKLAETKDTTLLTINARKTCLSMDFLRWGASAPSDPIIMPMEAGFPKLQMANVAIVMLRG